MCIRRVALLAALAVARASSVQADAISGAALTEMCVKYEPRASYYILGAVDAFNVRVGQPRRFCFPKDADIPAEHLTNIVCGFVSKHPEQQELGAGILVFRSLRDAYPCRNGH